MKSKFIKSGLFVIGIITLSIFRIESSSSGTGSAYSGAPNESSCNSCHNTFSLQTSGTNHGKIKLAGNFTGSGYIPDSTYTITVSYRESGKSVFGFQVTSLSGNAASGYTAAGTFTSTNNRTQTFSASSRNYIEHTKTGSSSVSTDSVAWVFQWKAPSKNVGNINFYLALNVTNSNGGTGNDYIYNKTFTFSPSTLLPIATADLVDTFACSNATLNFKGISTGSATAYSWRFPGGTPAASNAQNPTVSYSSTGAKIAILTTTNSKGISNPDTLKFTVITGATTPIVTPPSANGVLPLCAGDTLDFNVQTVTNHTYTWNNGSSQTNLKIDTTSAVYVTAFRSNGCKKVSQIYSVLLVPKPVFGVSYGQTADSICKSEPLLIFTKNLNGFSDSYSLTSETGPYSRDSFLKVSIKQGFNATNVWSKSKNGCVSKPFKKEFTGVDTQEAPLLFVKQKFVDKVIFGWVPLNSATEYRYTIDSGKSWNYPSNGKLSDSQEITLNSPTQRVNFWIQARTNKFCGLTKIGSLSGQGIGCSDITYTVNTKGLKFCTDSLGKIEINGLEKSKNYGIFFDNVKLTDTIFNYTVIKNQSHKIRIIDSALLSCGYTEKSIFIISDSLQQVKGNFKENQIFTSCGFNDSTQIQFNISNSKIDDSYTFKFSDRELVRNTSNNIITLYPNDSFYVTRTSKNGCTLQSSYFNSFFSHPINTRFNKEWVSGYQYLFTSNDQTPSNLHKWTVNQDTFKVLANSPSFQFDFVDYKEQNIPIKLEVTDSKTLNTLNDKICKYSEIQQIDILDFTSTIIVKKSLIGIFPNPTNNNSELHCKECSPGNSFILYGLDGKTIFETFVTDDLKVKLPEGLSNGQYLFQIIGKNQINRGKLIYTNN